MSSSHITVDEHHFCHAARDGDVDVVRAELSRGVPPDTRYRGQTALMYAAEADRADVCAVLLENGARPDAIDTYGRTPLHLCSRTTALSACRVLLEYGAAATSDVPSRMGLGETAVDVAKHRGVIELVRLVVFKKGVDLDASLTALRESVTSPSGDAADADELADVSAITAPSTAQRDEVEAEAAVVEEEEVVVPPVPPVPELPRMAPTAVRDTSHLDHTPRRTM
eukprot:PhM_4_TR4912/c0_g1_i1/m.57073